MENFKDITNNITKELDKLSGLDEKKYQKHYIMISSHFINMGRLIIRIPGSTVGCIFIDKNNTITKITIINNDFFVSYPKDINKIMEKYIGTKINIED